MENQDQITIQKNELPQFREWLEKKNKKIIKIIELDKNSLQVIIENN